MSDSSRELSHDTFFFVGRFDSEGKLVARASQLTEFREVGVAMVKSIRSHQGDPSYQLVRESTVRTVEKVK